MADRSVRKAVFFNDIKSVQTTDLVFSHPESILNNDERGLRALIKLDYLLGEDRNIFKELCQTLNVDVPVYVGMSAFDPNYCFLWFSSPQLILKDGQVVLMIGCDHGDYKAVYIPLEVKEDNGEFKYFLNGVRVSLLYIESNSIRYPVLGIKTDSYTVHIRIKLPKGIEYSDVEWYWESGSLVDIVLPLFGVGCRFTNMFLYSFEMGTFPKNGVLLILENGIYKEFEWEGKIIKSSQWKLAWTSHPEIPVYNWNKKQNENDPEKVLSLLSEIGTISFPMNRFASPSIYLESLQMSSGNINVVVPRYFLHVICPNKRDISWTPINAGGLDFAKLSPQTRSIFHQVPQVLSQLKASDPIIDSLESEEDF